MFGYKYKVCLVLFTLHVARMPSERGTKRVRSRWVVSAQSLGRECAVAGP